MIEKHMTSLPMAGIGVAVLAAGLLFAACSQPITDEIDEAVLGDTLEISGTVYRRSEGGAYRPWLPDGEAAVASSPDIGGEGKLDTGAWLTFSIGTPSVLEALTADAVNAAFTGADSGAYQNITISRGSVAFAVLKRLKVGGGEELEKTLWSTKYPDEVFYIYVSADVALSAEGIVPEGSDTPRENINLELRAGWNALQRRFNERSGTIILRRENAGAHGWGVRGAAD
jgi:hypothetical protein